MTYTSLTISQAWVKAPGSLVEPSLCEEQYMMPVNDQWSGTLSWPGEESDVCASVQATDGVRDPQLSAWPPHLRLEIVGNRIRALDLHAWILKHRAPVARIECAAGVGKQDVGKLVKSLREDGRVAIARLEVEGSQERGLVLAPLHDGGLLCAAFLTSDIPEFPKPSLEQPRQEKELKADCTRAVDIPFRTPEYSQGDNQTNVFVAGPALVQPTRCRNNSHRSSDRLAYEDRSYSRRLAYEDHCHSHWLTCKDRYRNRHSSRASGVTY